MSIYAGLKFTTKEINMNFRIKINQPPHYVSGKRVSKGISICVGVAGLIRYVGDIEKVNRMLQKAFDKGTDVFERKMRRNAVIRFYSK